MKHLIQKINRGILLTTVVLLAVIVYLIVLVAAQAGEKPHIEEACRRYVDLEIRYSMLPADVRSGDADMPEEKLEAYLLDMESVLAPQYIDNDRILELALERLRNSLTSQAEGWSVIQEYEKAITSFESFSFSGSEVTVIFKTQTSIERTESTGAKTPSGRIAGETTDTMVLQKQGDDWRVVYATLYEPNVEFRY